MGAHSGPGRLSSATALVSAALAASCCLLPLVLIVTGLAGAGLMMTLMQYEWVTLPAGVVGLGVRTSCICHIGGSARRLAVPSSASGRREPCLGVATLVVIAAVLLRVFPSWTATLLQHLH